jgi:hypothetical protein
MTGLTGGAHDAVPRRRARCVPDGLASGRFSSAAARLLSASAMACCRSSLPRRYARAARVVKAAPAAPLAAAIGRLPQLPLSSSRASRLGRPTDVASRWLRQPRPGTPSQGSGVCKEDGQGKSAAEVSAIGGFAGQAPTRRSANEGPTRWIRSTRGR